MESDRRLHQRFDIHLPAEIIGEDGGVFPVTALNISRAGLQLGCAQWIVGRVLPKAHQTAAVEAAELQVRLMLPLSDGAPAALDARCKVIFVRRLALDEYCIGVQYAQVQNGSAVNLERYLHACGMPAGKP